ncbi:MAG: hypothetical protein QOG33_2644, partial [Gaiellales bacterium]|nr:hypothetical protein [Gaiellales bacterium]
RRRADVRAEGKTQAMRVSGLEMGSRPAGERRIQTTVIWSIGSAMAVLAVNLLFDRYLFWDSYLDLAAGRYISGHGIPHHEVFTVAARGQTWIDQQWLAHLVYYGSWRLGGYPLVAIVSSAAVAIAFGLLTAFQIARGAHPQRAVLWTAAAYVVCMGNTVIRAQVLAFPLFVALVWGVVDDSHQPRLRARVWLVAPILVLWSNLHGSALLAAVIVTTYALYRALRLHSQRASALGYGAVAFLAALTVFANPYGLSVLDYYRSLIGNSVVRQYIAEWGPPSFGSVFSIGFIAMLIATCLVQGYVLGKGRRPSAPAAALLVLTALLASQGIRYQAWFGIVAAAVNSEALAAAGHAPHELATRVKRGLFGLVATCAVAALAVVLATSNATFEQLQPTRAMAAAAAYANDHPSVRVLADDTTSSALLWKYPSLQGRVAFDARLEQFTQSDLRQWFEFITVSGPSWMEVARGYDVAVVSRRDHPELARALERARGWASLYSDADGLVVVRSGEG